MQKRLVRSAMLAVLALAMAACCAFGILGLTRGARAAEGEARLGPEVLIEEDFENAEPAPAENGFTAFSDYVSGGPGNSYEIVTDEATGNKSLKMMYLEDTDDRVYSTDERALVVRSAGMVPYQNYMVSFYAKRATNIWIAMELRSGMPSKNYGEFRTMSTQGNDAFSEARTDKGVLVYQIVPADPSGLLEFTLNPRKVLGHDKGLGLILDDIRVQPFSAAPDGKENLLDHGDMQAVWHEDTKSWDFNDGDPLTDDWALSVGAGIDVWTAANRLSGTDNVYLGTADGAPVSISQHVSLEPQTEYNFSLYVRRFFQGTIWKAEDTLSVYISDGNGYESRVTFYTKDIGQDAFEQYVKIGGVLKTGDATDYTFYIQHDVPLADMSWRGFQVDEAALYKADNIPVLAYGDAQTSGVTETEDAFSGVEGDTVLQADLSQQAARIVYELDVSQGTYYTAAVDAQKPPRPVGAEVADGSATFNAVKPMNIRVSVETAADGGEVLAAMTDDRGVMRAIETFRLHFNSGSHDKVYLIVTADKIESADQFAAYNTLLNFKNFSLAQHEVTGIEAEGRTVVVGDTGSVEVSAVLSDGRRTPVEGAAFTPENGNVTFEGSAFTAAGVGTCEVAIAWNGQQTSVLFTVLDVIEGIDAGEDREIRLSETGSLTVTATYASTEPEDVTAAAEVVVADPSVLGYADGTFTALKVGQSEVTVSFRGETDTFTVTVPKELTRIDAGEDRTLACNGTYTVRVTGYYNDGTSAELEAASYTVQSAAPAVVSAEGNVLTAVAQEGSALITVTAQGPDGELTDTFTVTATDNVTSIDAGDDREIELNEYAALTVTAAYQSGGTKDVTADSEVDVADPSVLSYAEGKLTALKVGQTLVTVTYSGQQDSFTVTVPRRLSSVDAGGDRDLAIGVPSPLTVTASYNDGTQETADIDEVEVTVTDTQVVRYENGAFTALKVGQTQATVSYGGKQATIALRVPKRLQEIVLLGEDGQELSELTLEKGESAELTVKGVYNDGTEKELNAVLASDAQCVVVSGHTVIAAKAGTATVTASYPGEQVQGTLTVTVPRRMESLRLSGPTGLTIGGTGEIAVYAVFNDDTEEAVTGAEIVSGGAAVTVEGYTLRAAAAGTAVITVRYGGLETTLTVTVINPVVSLKVTCPALTAGGSVTLSVTAVYADGSEKALTEAEVTVTDTSVATAEGFKIAGVSAGTTQIVVRAEGAAAQIDVTVSAAPADDEGGCGSFAGTGACLAAAAAALCAACLALLHRHRKGEKR